MRRRSSELPPDTAAPYPAAAGTPAAAGALPVILVVDGDGGLSYLLARYAKRGGLGFRQLSGPPQRPPAMPDGPATLWFPSLERLEAVRPRESGLVGDDWPVIVCASVGEESRAHGLGADFCVTHPLRYPDFLAALRAVGIATTAGRQDVPARRTEPESDGGSARTSGQGRD